MADSKGPLGESKAMWEWSNQPSSESAKKFAEEPALIRALLVESEGWKDAPGSSREDTLAYLLFEAELAVKEYGMDPVWVDYIVAQSKDPIRAIMGGWNTAADPGG